MELVEGETLHERIARGRIPAAEAFALFIQIAEGLVKLGEAARCALMVSILAIGDREPEAEDPRDAP